MRKRSFWKTRTSGSVKAIHPVKGTEIEVDPQKDAKIGADINKELRRQPALLHWYMQLRDVAEEQYREARFVEHKTEEDLDEELRVTLEKATETTVKMAIRRDARMRNAYRARMDAKTMLAKLETAVKVIDTKGWMLRSLANDNRVERTTRDSF